MRRHYCARTAALSGAILRVSTVLQEIVDSARAFTGADLGTTIDDADEVEWFRANGPAQVRAVRRGRNDHSPGGQYKQCRAGGAKRQPPKRA